MKAYWQLQEAKNKLSRVVEKARVEGPQTITVHGKAAAVVMSVEAYKKLARPRQSLVDFFRKSPLRGIELDLTRSRDTGRMVKL